jgi:hypothetical protein
MLRTAGERWRSSRITSPGATTSSNGHAIRATSKAILVENSNSSDFDDTALTTSIAGSRFTAWARSSQCIELRSAITRRMGITLDFLAPRQKETHTALNHETVSFDKE